MRTAGVGDSVSSDATDPIVWTQLGGSSPFIALSGQGFAGGRISEFWRGCLPWFTVCERNEATSCRAMTGCENMGVFCSDAARRSHVCTMAGTKHHWLFELCFSLLTCRSRHVLIETEKEHYCQVTTCCVPESSAGVSILTNVT